MGDTKILRIISTHWVAEVNKQLDRLRRLRAKGYQKPCKRDYATRIICMLNLGQYFGKNMKQTANLTGGWPSLRTVFYLF